MKAIVNVNGREIIVSVETAAKIVDLCEGAEQHRSDWHPTKDGVPSFYTYHVFPITADEGFTIKVVTEDYVNMCRAAGKPQ